MYLVQIVFWTKTQIRLMTEFASATKTPIFLFSMLECTMHIVCRAKIQKRNKTGCSSWLEKEPLESPYFKVL